MLAAAKRTAASSYKRNLERSQMFFIRKVLILTTKHSSNDRYVDKWPTMLPTNVWTKTTMYKPLPSIWFDGCCLSDQKSLWPHSPPLYGKLGLISTFLKESILVRLQRCSWIQSWWGKLHTWTQSLTSLAVFLPMSSPFGNNLQKRANVKGWPPTNRAQIYLTLSKLNA